MTVKYPESQRVKLLRGSLSLRSFAEKFDITGSNISAIEADRQGLAVPLARKIAEHYNVSLDWLYGNVPLESEQIDDDRNKEDNIDLKNYRTTMGITQEAMASELGISRQTLVNYENGQIPSSVREKLSQQIIRIGNISKIDIKEFIGNRLRELRGSNPRRETAEKLNITMGRYDALENGKLPIDPIEIITIADTYNISIDYLFGREATSQTQNQTPSIEQSSTPSADTTSNSTNQSLLIAEKDERIKVLEQLIAQQKDVIDIYKKLANPGK